MKKRILLLAALLMISLSSCTVFKSVFSGYPMWYYRKNTNSQQLSFIGEAKAQTRRQAELLAYTDVSDKLSSYLGIEIDRELYRELSTQGTIAKFGLSVTGSSISSSDGMYRVIVLAVADRAKADSFRSQEAKELGDTLQKIEQLILEGDEYIKSGKDIMGVRNYLMSMALSCNIDARNLDKEYSFDVILQEVLHILEKMRIDVKNENPQNLTCNVSVRRSGNILSSPVAQCPVKASYVAMDAQNKSYNDTFVFYTDEDGIASFYAINPAVTITGNIKFSINLDSEVAAIEKLDPEAAQQIRSALDNITDQFEYHREYSMGRLVVTAISYSNYRIFEDSAQASEHLVSRFVEDGAPAYANPADTDLSEGILIDRARLTYKDAGILLVVRTGVLETVESSTGVVVSSHEGRACLYRLSDGECLFDSGVVYSVGFGKDAESALADGRDRMETIIYSTIKAVYV